MSAISGLHAASAEPFAKPIKEEDIKSVVNPSA